MGPGGDMLALWSKACTISLRNNTGVGGWQDRLIALLPEHLQKPASGLLDAIVEADISGSPVGSVAKSTFGKLCDRALEASLVCVTERPSGRSRCES